MKQILTFLVGMTFLVSNLNAQSTGTVFRDYNGNGTKEANEPVVPGVTVNAYNAADVLVGSTVTIAAGTWGITPTGGYPIRIEFVLNSATSTNCFFSQGVDFSGYSGGTYGSNVRFLSVQTTGVNFAINYPGDYATNLNPRVATSVFTNGNLTGGAGNSGNLRDAVTVQYNTINAVSPTPASNITQVSRHQDIGSVWGVASHVQSGKLFYAAVLKRHSALGPNGSGAVYITDPAATTGATLLFDLDALGFPTRATGTYPYTATPGQALVNNIPFTGVIGTNTQRGIPTGTTPYSSFGSPGDAHSYDAAALAQIGKVSLGGLDVSDDGKYVFVMNLFDKKLYRITLVNPATPGTPAVTAADVKSFTLTDPAYTGGTYRPWAVKYYRGKVFVGMTNDLSSTTLLAGTTSIANGSEATVPKYANAKGSIYSLDDPATAGAGTISFVTDIALNYAKLAVAGEIDGFDKLAASAVTDGVNENHVFRYNPWTDDYDKFKQDNTGGNMKLCFPQPILSDIEFDMNNNAIVVGVLDRFGLQCSYRTYSPKDMGPDDGPLGGTQASYGNSELASGDIIKVPFTSVCAIGTILPNNSASNNEFYTGDYYGNAGVITPPFHNEIATGGVSLLPGTNEVIINCYDPSTTNNSGGLRTLSNATGQADNNGTVQYGANVYDGTTRGLTSAKGLAMGDVEYLRELAPTEIGNRVWNDANGDGIQEAGEAGIGGVALQIFVDNNNDGVADGAAIGTTTTASSGDIGSWYFNNANITGDADPNTAGVQAALTTGINYIVRPAAAAWTGGAGVGVLAGYRLTSTDRSGSGAADLSDNDAAIVSTIPQISVTIGRAGENNHNLDIGFTQLARLGNRVWLDMGAGGGTANNGVQDGTEPGVAGVPVMLYRNGADGSPGTNDDILVGATITDAYGIYFFDLLPPTDQTNATTIGQTSYNVRVTAPANYSFTTQTNTTDDNLTTGISTTGSDVNPLGVSYGVNLSNAETNPNIDAGLIFRTVTPPNSIGDRVWFDTNGDGNQDSGEPGVSGITVILYASDGVTIVAVTSTDANGNYLFNNLPPSTDYIVGFSAPGGTIFSPNIGGTTPGNATTNSDANATTGKTGIVNTGVAGTQQTGVDAGIRNDTKAALGDFVWNDLDHDGIQDAGEPGIPGITMDLYSPGPDGLIGGGDDIFRGTTKTDAKGYYIFPNLDPGTYFVVATPPAGYTVSPKDVTAGNLAGDVKDNDFGAGSAPYAGKYVSGLYGLPTTVGGLTRDMTVDMGIYSSTANLNSIGDKVWNDVNNNGLQDGGEAGVPNVTVRLLNGSGVAVNNPATGSPYVVVTDTAGNYKFVDLPDGNYIVEFANIPSGYSFTSHDASGSGAPGSGTDGTDDSDPKTTTGRTAVINLDAASLIAVSVNLTNVDAGIVQGIPAGTASLGNRVWYDLNNDGLQTAGELGVANVRVELLDGSGNPIDSDPNTAGVQAYIVFTNALGEYLFTGLAAGDYTVRFSRFPAGYTSSTANAGSNDAIDADANFAGLSVTAVTTATTGTYTLQTGEDNLTVDMGIVPLAGTNSLGNFVWFDQDNNGKQDAGEPGTQGVQVTLFNSGLDGIAGTSDDAFIGITTTDSLGRYMFVGLADGNYNVGFSNLPAGYTFTAQNAGGTTAADGSDAHIANGRTVTIALDPSGLSLTGVSNIDNDAGLVTTRAALGNYVWLDTNADGVQNSTEPGVPGVTVILYASDGTTVLASTITDANGKYYFGNLTPGDFVVGFSTVPSNLAFTQQNTPGDNQNNTNSDANPATGKTAVINLIAGEIDLTIDAGLKPNIPASVGDYVWNDVDGDGVQDINEPGVPGIIVTLYNSSNVVVGTAITDGNGRYLISNVTPGTGFYIIFSNLPPTAEFTTRTSNVTQGDATLGSDADAAAGPNFGRTAAFDLAAGQYLPTVDAGIRKVQLLPVRLVSFTAQPQGSTVQLQWNVTEQLNINSYVVEFSTDGRNFAQIANVPANSNATATYNTVHANPVIGINYYRIKITERSGNISYSEIRRVNFGKGGNVIVYPNPAKDIVNITLSGSFINKPTSISVIAFDGKVLSTQNITSSSQIENVDVRRLPAGKYIIRIVTATEVVNKTIEVIR